MAEAGDEDMRSENPVNPVLLAKAGGCGTHAPFAAGK
jgi:hypothetical protein